MELTVAKKDLLKIVARMQGVAERKSTMPVLANVLLAVDGTNALRLAATDLYLSLLGRVPADVSKPGSVAVSAKDLFERVKMMPDGPIVIATQDNATTTLKASGSARRYTLRGMPGDDFPPLPQPAEGSPTLALDVDVLSELIAEDALLDLDRRDARAPEQRAVRVGRRHRSHGHDGRSSPVEGRREGRGSSGVGDDADPAEGHPGAASPLRRDDRRRRRRSTRTASAASPSS